MTTSLRASFDPNAAFPNATPLDLLEACGFIPGWIAESPDLPMRDALDINYAFAGGFQPFNGPSLDAQGRFTYPGDPPLDPLLVLTCGNETLRQYKYGLVALTTGDTTEFARLD